MASKKIVDEKKRKYTLILSQFSAAFTMKKLKQVEIRLKRTTLQK